MWYSRTSAYSTDLGILRDQIRSGLDPYSYPSLVHEYLETDQTPEEPHEHGYSWLDSASPEELESYRNWLENSSSRYKQLAGKQ